MLLFPLYQENMNLQGYKAFEENLANAVDIVSARYNIMLLSKDSSRKLEELILALQTDNKGVVILIDEYDKPMLDNIIEDGNAKKIRSILKSFYGQIKANERYIRFAFITGVSKFTQVSLFSDLNNLKDLTMDKNYAGICGFTQEECEKLFAPWLAENAKELDITQDAYLAKLKDMFGMPRQSNEKIISIMDGVEKDPEERSRPHA